MILISEDSAGNIAITHPVRPMRAAEMRPEYSYITGVNFDEVVTVPAAEIAPAETLAEYRASIEADVPAGFTPRAWIDPAELAAVMHGPDIDTDDADALQIGTHPRAYRAALAWNGSTVIAPAAKRRAALLAKLREKRDRALIRSDALIARATETGNTAAADALRAYRQALRDLPQTWDGNPATLAAAWPARPSV